MDRCQGADIQIGFIEKLGADIQIGFNEKRGQTEAKASLKRIRMWKAYNLKARVEGEGSKEQGTWLNTLTPQVATL